MYSIEILMRIVAASLFSLYWHILMGQVKTEYVFKHKEQVQMSCIAISFVASAIVTTINYFITFNTDVYELYLYFCMADAFILVASIFSKHKGWHGDYKNKIYFSYNEDVTSQMKQDTQIGFELPGIYSSSKIYQIEDYTFVGQIDLNKGQNIVIDANPIDINKHIYAIEGIFDKRKKVSIYEALMWVHLTTLAIGVVLMDNSFMSSSCDGSQCSVFALWGYSLVQIALLFSEHLFKKDAKKNIIARLCQIFSGIIYLLSILAFPINPW